VTTRAQPTRNILEIANLKLTYGGSVHAVQDASLIIREGEAVGIAGESGSGKSTLARAVTGLLPKDLARISGGHILIDGEDVTGYRGQQWERLRGNPIAMVFQDPLSVLNPVVRVGNQIAESVRRHDRGVDPTARSYELLDLVKLRRDVLRRYPHELSGGMRQRVMLAIALGCRPRLLIADEPTTALDVTTQAEILALLGELRATLRMSLLLISHDLGVLRWNCDRIYIMYAGHTIETGATADVLHGPAHPYSRGLIEASKLRQNADGLFATISGDVPALDQTFQLCPFLSRCRLSVERCRSEMPPQLAPGVIAHDARCWLTRGGAQQADDDRRDTLRAYS
jgi:oligopeptide/dipeptide ABC transporter ATP-binding protein